MKDKRHRVTIDITLEQEKFLSQLPYGKKKELFGSIIDLLIYLTSLHGGRIFQRIIAQKIDIKIL